MAKRVHACLYTRQKTQRSKKWQDGEIHILLQQRKVVVKSEDGVTVESSFLKQSVLDDLDEGSSLELDSHLVEVEAALTVAQPTTPAPPPPISVKISRRPPPPSRNGLSSAWQPPPNHSNHHLPPPHRPLPTRLPMPVASFSEGSSFFPNDIQVSLGSGVKRKNDSAMADLFSGKKATTTPSPSSYGNFPSTPSFSSTSQAPPPPPPPRGNPSSLMANCPPPPFSNHQSTTNTSSLAPRRLPHQQHPRFLQQQQQQQQQLQQRERPEHTDHSIPALNAPAPLPPHAQSSQRPRIKAGLSRTTFRPPISSTTATSISSGRPPQTSRLGPMSAADFMPSSPANAHQPSSSSQSFESSTSGPLSTSLSRKKRALGPPLHPSTSNKKPFTCPNVISRVEAKRPRLTGNPSAIWFPDEEACHELTTSGRVPIRTATIADRFASASEYAACFSKAIVEDINMHMLDLAVKYRMACLRLCPGVASTYSPSCSHGYTKKVVVAKEGPNCGRQFFSCAAKKRCDFFMWAEEYKPSGGAKITSAPKLPSTFRLQAKEVVALRRQHVPAYTSINLFYQSSQAESRSNSPSARTTLFLSLKDCSQEHSSAYSMDDLWIVSSSPSFSLSSSSSSLSSSRNGGHFVVVVRSVFHGPARSSLLEVRLISGSLPRQQRHWSDLYALRGPNCVTEFLMLDTLSSLTTTAAIPSFLLGQISPSPIGAMTTGKHGKVLDLTTTTPRPFRRLWELDDAVLDELADKFIALHTLNIDQEAVLRQMTDWFRGDAVDTRPEALGAILVHGVFGSGKSSLIVVLIMLLQKIAETIEEKNNKRHGEEAGGGSVGVTSAPKIRVLVVSATNVAVDRILCLLLRHDFTDFARVGSLRKISKEVLDYTITGRAGDADAMRKEVRELKGQLKLSKNKSERSFYRKCIADLQSESNQELKRNRLDNVFVVGTTCAASTFPVLEGSVFPIVILDECSQMVEPLSLLPIARFRCRYMIGAGDPLQLPPTLMHYRDPSDTTNKPNSKSISNSSNTLPTGLAKTLYGRLASCGVRPTMLRTQYRCHPVISKIPNTLFYHGMLRDGIGASDRDGLLPDLPPLMFCNSAGTQATERAVAGGSFDNPFEAEVVATLVSSLLRKGLTPSQIGVICLYKRQVETIKEALSVAGQIAAASPTTPKHESRADDDRVTKDIDEHSSGDVEAEDDEKQEEKEGGDDDDDYDGHGEEAPGEATGHYASDVVVNTVDSAQGSEQEVIIVSCTRTSALGFITLPNRLNVALTRARRHLLLVGHRDNLEKSPLFRYIINTAKGIRGGIKSGRDIVMFQSYAVYG